MSDASYEQKALDLVEKRVRCANLFSTNGCEHKCELCQYGPAETLTDAKEYARALEFIWKTAKHKLESRERAAEEKILCKYLSPCGLCEKLSDAFGMPTKCTERGKNNARNC